jgi:hypothetical protein
VIVVAHNKYNIDVSPDASIVLCACGHHQQRKRRSEGAAKWFGFVAVIS